MLFILNTVIIDASWLFVDVSNGQVLGVSFSMFFSTSKDLKHQTSGF